MDRYTLNQIKAIVDKANEKKDNIFDKMGWEHHPRLSEGDIKVVLEAEQELFIEK